MNKKIFVVVHKEAKLPKNELYSPIVVGNKKFNFPNNYYRDDIGENIASKNENYCELTALYWIWKNIKNYKIIGMCHYRRYFVKRMKQNFEMLITEEEIDKILKNYDIILPQKRIFFKRNIKEQYYSRDNAFKKDYEMLGEVIKEIYPEYASVFEKVSNNNSTYLYNMFITKEEILNQYCEWLFKILFELERRIDLSNYSKEQKRVFGFLAERLMTIYVEKNNLKIKEINVLNFEKNLKEERIIALKNKIKRCFIK